MGKTIFDLVKTYEKGAWVEVTSRKFTEAELQLIEKCVVTKGDYSMSVRVDLTNDKMLYFTLDKRESCSVGEELSKETLELVHLKYEGNSEKVKVKETIVVRIDTPIKKIEEINFDNPFGL